MVAIHNTMTCHHVPCKKQCKDERGNVRMIKKGEIDEHLMNDCPNRDYKCDICGETGTYADIIHGKACDGKPSTCPNVGCTKVIRRRGIAPHLVKCMHTLVPCKFRDIGCEVTLKRMDISQHEKEAKGHLTMALDKVVELRSKSVMLGIGCIQMVASAAGVSAKMLEAAWRTAVLKQCIEADLERVKTQASMRDRMLTWVHSHICEAVNLISGKVIFKITNVMKESRAVFRSPTFYNRQRHQSYHMCVSVHMDVNHVISVSVSMVPGEFDDHLSWPFVGDVYITLLNQHHNGDHLSMSFTVSAADNMKVGETLGSNNLLSLSEMMQDSDPNKQYLLDDTLYFQISVVDKNRGDLLCSI